MNNRAMTQRIKTAKNTCGDKEKGLTEKRQRVFELLLNAASPLSAYELTDAYNAAYSPPIKAMSVYRILDYLTSVHLTHRLNSANKYIACANQPRCNGHALSLFLICSVCQKVEESSIASEFGHLLTKNSKDAGFQIHGSQLEMSGICSYCQQSELQPVKGNSVDESTTD